MWDYTEIVQDHFLNPRNVGVIEDADGIGDVGSLSCGDALKFYFKLGDDGRIADARFMTFGCASAIASSSALTLMVIGKTLEEAEKITNEDIADFLGGLPKEKMHCSVMGREALEASIANYRGVELPKSEGDVVCECFGVTDVDIRRAIEESGLKTLEDVTNFTKAGGGCGKCEDRIQEIIDEARSSAKIIPMNVPRMTNMQKIKKIEALFEREIRPNLKRDSGDIELVDVDGDDVYVSLRGACVSCAKSQITLKEYVEKKLREEVLDTLVVKEA